jgi:hypothetical protein
MIIAQDIPGSYGWGIIAGLASRQLPIYPALALQIADKLVP